MMNKAQMTKINERIRKGDRLVADYVIEALNVELDGRMISICYVQGGEAWKHEGKADRATFKAFVANRCGEVQFLTFQDIESITIENRAPKQRKMRRGSGYVTRSEIYSKMISAEELAKQDAQYEQEAQM